MSTQLISGIITVIVILILSPLLSGWPHAAASQEDESDLWLVPEDERFYNNSVTPCRFFSRENYSEMAYDIGERLNLLPMKASDPPGSYVIESYVYADNSRCNINQNVVEFHTWQNGTKSNHTDRRTSILVEFDGANISEGRIGQSKDERIVIATMLVDQLNITTFNLDTIQYWEREDLNGAYVRVFQKYLDSDIICSYVECGFYLDSGKLASLYITPLYDVTVIPYLTVTGAKQYALETWGGKYTDIRDHGYYVFQHRLYYDVGIVHHYREPIGGSSNRYLNGTRLQSYFVDVQNAEVIIGPGAATGSEIEEENSNAYQQFAIILTLGICAGIGAVIVRAKRR